MIARRRPHKAGIAQRRRADHHTGDAQCDPAVDRGHGADAAPHLHIGGRGRQDCLHRRRVAGFAREGAVQIDHMQPFRAGFGKGAGLRGRILRIDGGARHVAFGEADDFATLQVDRGKDGKRHQGFQASQRARRESP